MHTQPALVLSKILNKSSLLTLPPTLSHAHSHSILTNSPIIRNGKSQHPQAAVSPTTLTPATPATPAATATTPYAPNNSPYSVFSPRDDITPWLSPRTKTVAATTDLTPGTNNTNAHMGSLISAPATNATAATAAVATPNADREAMRRMVESSSMQRNRADKLEHVKTFRQMVCVVCVCVL